MSKRYANLSFMGVLTCLFCLEASSQEDTRDYMTIENIPVTYRLPRTKNGLTVPAFIVKAKIRMSRWENKADLILDLDAVQSTPGRPKPSFTYSYMYNGVEYGDQHVGKEVFDGIEAGTISYKVTVIGNGNSWTKTVIGHHNTIASVPKNERADAYTVRVSIEEIIGFNGTGAIEDKIGMLVVAKKNKDKYDQHVREADNAFKNKKWYAAISNYEQALAYLPDESYPQRQLEKIKAQQQAEAEKKETAAGNSTAQSTKSNAKPNSTGSSGAGADDDFWNEKSSTSNKNTNGSSGSSSTGSSTPKDVASMPMLKQANGKYYVKDEYGNYQETTQQAYEAIKQSQAASQRQQSGYSSSVAGSQRSSASTEEQVKAIQSSVQKRTDDYWAEIDNNQKKHDANFAKWQQSYYAAEAVRGGEQNLNKLRRLDGNYNSLEELEAEFQEKYNSINQEVNSLNEARDQKLQANVDYLFSDADASGKAIGTTVALVGTLVNSLKADKEKKQAQEALEKAKAEETAKYEARKKALTLELRNSFLAQFPDGGVPLSAHKVGTNELYFFSYTFERNTIGAANPSINVTNVFPIMQYGDGTWPFKSTIVSELRKLGGAGTITLMGYYGTRELAQQMQTSFLQMAGKCGFIVKNTHYKGKKTSGATSNGDDFWETGKKKDATTEEKKPAVKKDDFWNN